MLSIGVAQTRNSTDVGKNYESIMEYLNRFERHDVDLVLFPLGLLRKDEDLH